MRKNIKPTFTLQRENIAFLARVRCSIILTRIFHHVHPSKYHALTMNNIFFIGRAQHHRKRTSVHLPPNYPACRCDETVVYPSASDPSFTAGWIIVLEYCGLPSSSHSKFIAARLSDQCNHSFFSNFVRRTMAKVQLANVAVLDNPSPFLNPFQFEVTFECIEELKEGTNLIFTNDNMSIIYQRYSVCSSTCDFRRYIFRLIL